MKIEEWRPVVGFEGSYEVSNVGRVRSLDREIEVAHPSGRRVPRILKGRILQPGTMKSGHQFLVLGRGNGFCVHTLVLNAFKGPCPDGMECCHGDGDPANNVDDNLRWDTRQSNVLDMWRHGRANFQNGARP